MKEQKTEQRLIDTSHTQEVTCPWCGYVHDDSYEFFTETHRECVEANCERCDRPITICEHRSVTYSTTKGWKETSSATSASSAVNNSGVGD